jgi:hypothetical protein
VLGLALLCTGCSDTATPSGAEATPTEEQTVDLDDAYGGFRAVSESPAFGDAELAGEAADEEVQPDGYAGLSIVEREKVEQLEKGRPVHYSFTALWGDLRNAEAGSIVEPAEGDSVVWDGAMTLSRGGIRLVCVIAFERPGDHVLPRVVPRTLEWVSTTTAGFDGLRVMLVVPSDSLAPAEPETLRFRAGTYERVFTTDRLEDLEEVVEFSESQQISFRAFRADPAVAVGGFCRGRWGWAPEDSVGRFKGHWVRAGDGGVDGTVRGHYGVNSQGERVFFGKYIDPQGGFRGFVRGTWEAASQGSPGSESFRESGTFEGRWVDEQGGFVGHVSGRWDRRGIRWGVFTGRWRGHWTDA